MQTPDRDSAVRAEDVKANRSCPLPSAMPPPFTVFFDHMLPTHYRPADGYIERVSLSLFGSVLTYLFEGQLQHKDSLGSDQQVGPGEVRRTCNWLVRPLPHIERTLPAGPGLQACTVGCRCGWRPRKNTRQDTASSHPDSLSVSEIWG